MPRITQSFAISEETLSMAQNIDDIISCNKLDVSREIGQFVTNTFGFKEDIMSNNDRSYTTSFIAFSEDDWMKFKQDLKEYMFAAESINASFLDKVFVGKLIKELEQK